MGVLELAIGSFVIAIIAGFAQVDLRKVLAYNDAQVMQRPEVMVPKAKEAFDADGRLIDEAALGFLQQLLRNVLAWTRHARNWTPPEG